MPVNIHEGPLVRLADIPAKWTWLPEGRRGAKVNFGTLYSWARTGRKNRAGRVVKLEVLRFGASLVTNEPALVRFLERCEGDDASNEASTPTQRRKAHQRAQDTLKALGV